MSAIGQLFSKPKTPAIPKPTIRRAPTDTSDTVMAAREQARRAALARKGRQSTIMTEGLGSMTGSSGQSLGA